MMNPAKLLKVKKAWDKFTRCHPKFSMFLQTVYKNGLEEGAVIDITYTNAAGKKISSNMKVSAADLDLLKELAGK